VFPYKLISICALLVFAYCPPSPGIGINRRPGEPGRTSTGMGTIQRGSRSKLVAGHGSF